MCYAIKLHLTTPNHIWILPSWYTDGWWNKADTFNWTFYAYQCNSSEIKKALKNTLLVGPYAHLEDPDEVSISGYVSVEKEMLIVVMETYFSLYTSFAVSFYNKL